MFTTVASKNTLRRLAIEVVLRALGFNFQKGRFRVAVLDRAQDGAVTLSANRQVTVDSELPLPELMERYAAQFKIQIAEFEPDVVAARQVWDAGNVVGATCQVAPFGIAALVSYEAQLPFRHYTPQALSQPTPFGLPKGTKPITAIDATFGTHPPHWDDIQRSAVLVGWRALRE